MTAAGNVSTVRELLQLLIAPPVWPCCFSAMAAQRLMAPLRLVAPTSHRALAIPPQKLATQREAVASAKVLLGAEVFHLVATSSMKKGDVLTVCHMLRRTMYCCDMRPHCDMHLISISQWCISLHVTA